MLLKGEPCSGLTHQTYDYADGETVLETGMLVREGPAEELLKDKALLESYLG